MGGQTAAEGFLNPGRPVAHGAHERGYGPGVINRLRERHALSLLNMVKGREIIWLVGVKDGADELRIGCGELAPPQRNRRRVLGRIGGGKPEIGGAQLDALRFVQQRRIKQPPHRKGKGFGADMLDAGQQGACGKDRRRKILVRKSGWPPVRWSAARTTG